ncbi:MAG: mucoidy inhibitor MuiA family protein [bacterium]
MKRALILWIILFTGFAFGQDEKKVDSKVTAATVFKNRAMVTREGKVDLPKGQSVIILSNLTTDLLDESVRISADGKGEIKILDVKVENKFTTETQQEKVKELENSVDSLLLLQQVILDESAVLEKKKEFVEALQAQSVKTVNEKLLLNITNTKNWAEMLGFVESNLEKIYKGLREQSNKKKFISEQVEALRLEILKSSGTVSKNYKEIIVVVELEKADKITLNSSYLVQSAGWYSLYDARVESKTKEMEMQYYGMVQQSTGEDWKDVLLTLSTAEPLSVKNIPQLDSWYLDIRPLPTKKEYEKNKRQEGNSTSLRYDTDDNLMAKRGSISGYAIDRDTGEPLMSVNIRAKGRTWGSTTGSDGRFAIQDIDAGSYTITASFIGYTDTEIILQVLEKKVTNIIIYMQVQSIQTNEVIVMADRPEIRRDITSSLAVISDNEGYTAEFGESHGGNISVKDGIIYSNAYAKELSTIFEIPTKNTIPSDNSAHKVTIAIEKLPIQFQYTSIPKVIPKVYLKGKITNSKDYPLLEGEINVFVDNDFVNKTYLNTIVPKDTLELALGVDESISCKKVLINKFSESTGLLSGGSRITYEYEIQITNNRATEETILIYDQIPIEMNEEIAVELIEPKIEIKNLDTERKLEWNLKLKPGEKKIIPVKYTVEFSKNTTVYGLE